MDIKFWNGDKDRELRLQPPCSCGCDLRDGDARPYLTASDEDGNGFTIRLDPDDIARLASQAADLT